MSSRLGGTFHIQCEDSTPDQRGTIARSATSKARLFGPSHWALPIMMLVSTKYCNTNRHVFLQPRSEMCSIQWMPTEREPWPPG